MVDWLMVALGGGVGAVLRYGVIRLIMKCGKPSFWSTVLVNLLGSFLLGLFVHSIIDLNHWYKFLVIGVLGAFTTFSTFSFDLVTMFGSNNWKRAALYLIVNLGGGIFFFSLGWAI